MTTQTKALLSCLANLVIIIAVAVSIFLGFVVATDTAGNMNISGLSCFVFFTIDSNVLAALACALILPYSFRKLPPPHWATLLKFVATVAVSITFLVSLCFLAPTMGFDTIFGGISLWLHLICPLLCLASLLFLENSAPLKLPEAALALLPVVLYGIVYAILVVPLAVWPDFYGFNIDGAWPLAALIVFLVSVLVTFLIWLAYTRLNPNRPKPQ